ncbi:MAG: 16S rRNA (guanine(527)-N(7))-methyltransferase RsmG [Ruminococcaceae bacterium]|nr:16S rRNA (guanine(527)-N(7))-methyltransferase RsmG [Oscillospiraceae bacterium]
MFDRFYEMLLGASNGVPEKYVSEENAKKLYIHITELSEKGKRFNLTAITDPEEAVNKHTADCLFCASVIDELTGGDAASLIDVGSGGGFPSLPIATALPHVSVTALDATAKKCGFIADTAALCGVNIITVPKRAEEYVAEGVRESFDFATARAVARLNILMELCAPFIKVGGYFVAMKGSAAKEEILEAENAAKKLGLTLHNVHPYTVKDGGDRAVLVYKKTSSTPASYPRMYSKIKKNPL